MNPVEKDVITEMDVYESMGKPRKSSDDSDDKEFTWNYVEDPASDSDEPNRIIRKSVTLTNEESSPISSVVRTVNAEESPTVELKKETPEEATPKEAKPEEATPKETTPKETTSKETTSEEAKPKETTPKEVKIVDSATQHDTESDTDSDMPPLVDDTSDESDDMPELVESSDENSSEDENSSDDEMMMMVFRDSDCRRCKTAIRTILNHPHDSDSDEETFHIKREFPNIIIYTFLLFTALHLVNLITTYCNVRPSY
jgi:hypothetical protein